MKATNPIDGMGPDSPVHENDQGGKQSHLLYRFDLFDMPALFAAANVLHQGAEKYGADNWRAIATHDHLNHAIAHICAHIAGDTSDDHLGHAHVRAMFAHATHLADQARAAADAQPVEDNWDGQGWFDEEPTKARPVGAELGGVADHLESIREELGWGLTSAQLFNLMRAIAALRVAGEALILSGLDTLSGV